MLLVPPEALARLAEKYRRLARMRNEHARGLPPVATSELRELAKEFPGSLSELDTMELHEIVTRAESLELAVVSGETSAWMIYVFAYHGALREALIIKRAHRVDAVESRTRSGLPIDDAFVAAVRAPPRGRVVSVVLEAIARWTGHDAGEIGRALIPRRRRKNR